jgi:hypothetical protein
MLVFHIQAMLAKLFLSINEFKYDDHFTSNGGFTSLVGHVQCYNY